MLRGNVVDLAVAVVLGAAFGSVVTSLVGDLITPLIAALVGEPDFSALTFTLNGSDLQYGSFLNALFAFAAIVVAVFFPIVRPVNALISRSRRQPTPDPTTKHRPECISEVPIIATRCAHCAIALAPVA